MKAPGNSPLSETTPTPTSYPHSSSLRPRLIPSFSPEFIATLISTFCIRQKRDYCTTTETSCVVSKVNAPYLLSKNGMFELQPYAAQLKIGNGLTGARTYAASPRVGTVDPCSRVAGVVRTCPGAEHFYFHNQTTVTKQSTLSFLVQGKMLDSEIVFSIKLFRVFNSRS